MELNILADDMGLGKTLTMVSLILKATEISKDTEEDNSDESSDDSHSKSMYINKYFIYFLNRMLQLL